MSCSCCSLLTALEAANPTSLSEGFPHGNRGSMFLCLCASMMEIINSAMENHVFLGSIHIYLRRGLDPKQYPKVQSHKQFEAVGCIYWINCFMEIRVDIVVYIHIYIYICTTYITHIHYILYHIYIYIISYIHIYYIIHTYINTYVYIYIHIMCVLVRPFPGQISMSGTEGPPAGSAQPPRRGLPGGGQRSLVRRRRWFLGIRTDPKKI